MKRVIVNDIENYNSRRKFEIYDIEQIIETFRMTT